MDHIQVWSSCNHPLCSLLSPVIVKPQLFPQSETSVSKTQWQLFIEYKIMHYHFLLLPLMWLFKKKGKWSTGCYQPPAPVENKHCVSTPPFFLLCSFSSCSPCCQRLIPKWQTRCGNSFLSEAPSISEFSTHPDWALLFIAASISPPKIQLEVVFLDFHWKVQTRMSHHDE